MSNKSKFYSTKQIDDTKAEYRLILGERSNGKSYALKGVEKPLGAKQYGVLTDNEVQGI